MNKVGWEKEVAGWTNDKIAKEIATIMSNSMAYVKEFIDAIYDEVHSHKGR